MPSASMAITLSGPNLFNRKVILIKPTFRCNAKKFFLTFPKCDKTPKEVLSKCVSLNPQPKVIIVAREQHNDGSYHIHIFIEFFLKKDIRNPLYFDHLCGQHGNISSVRNVHSTLRYITKDDHWVIFGLTRKALGIIISGTSYTLGEVAAFIADTPDINEVAVKYPTHFIHYHGGLSHLCDIHRHRASTKTVPFLRVNLHRSYFGNINVQSLALLDWFENAFITDHFGPLPLRTRQLWLHGVTGCGKTRFLAFLNKHYRGFLVAASEKFYNGYNDYDIDFIYMDEFHGKPIYWMNSLLGGEPMNMAFKGGQYCKRLNKPVIISSNLTPGQCYTNISLHRPLVWEAFLSRLVVIDVSDANLHALIDILDDEPEEEISSQHTLASTHVTPTPSPEIPALVLVSASPPMPSSFTSDDESKFYSEQELEKIATWRKHFKLPK